MWTSVSGVVVVACLYQFVPNNNFYSSTSFVNSKYFELYLFKVEGSSPKFCPKAPNFVVDPESRYLPRSKCVYLNEFY